jgi:hypothetical protein
MTMTKLDLERNTRYTELGESFYDFCCKMSWSVEMFSSPKPEQLLELMTADFRRCMSSFIHQVHSVQNEQEDKA